jgi:hypothetical protein
MFSLARIAGHSAWWAFVVATLFAGGITWTGLDRYIPVIPLPRGSGWIDISPGSTFMIADIAGSSYDPWSDPELWSAIAFAAVLIAAVLEAISAREVLPGIMTVAAPCIGWGLLLSTTPGVFDSVRFNTMQAMAVVLLAVAVREVWARRFAPRPN